jgi:hypothetical protein
MAIYFTSLEDPTLIDNVLAFLEPYVPYTLGLIGNIVNSRPELVKAIKFYLVRSLLQWDPSVKDHLRLFHRC